MSQMKLVLSRDRLPVCVGSNNESLYFNIYVRDLYWYWHRINNSFILLKQFTNMILNGIIDNSR